MVLYTWILYWILKLYTLLKILYIINIAWNKQLSEKILHNTNMNGNQLTYKNVFQV